MLIVTPHSICQEISIEFFIKIYPEFVDFQGGNYYHLLLRSLQKPFTVSS